LIKTLALTLSRTWLRVANWARKWHWKRGKKPLSSNP
jgi:hypothetical protein